MLVTDSGSDVTPTHVTTYTHAGMLTTTQSNHVDTLIITYTHAIPTTCKINQVYKFTYKIMVIKIYQVQSYKIKKIYYISRITHASIKYRKKDFYI